VRDPGPARDSRHPSSRKRRSPACALASKQATWNPSLDGAVSNRTRLSNDVARRSGYSAGLPPPERSGAPRAQGARHSPGGPRSVARQRRARLRGDRLAVQRKHLPPDYKRKRSAGGNRHPGSSASARLPMSQNARRNTASRWTSTVASKRARRASGSARVSTGILRSSRPASLLNQYPKAPQLFPSLERV